MERETGREKERGTRERKRNGAGEKHRTTNRSRQTERQTERQTDLDRQRDKPRDRHKMNIDSYKRGKGRGKQGMQRNMYTGKVA